MAIKIEGGTLGCRVVCSEGYLTIDVLRDGERVDVMALGPCPHCRPSAPETPLQESTGSEKCPDLGLLPQESRTTCRTSVAGRAAPSAEVPVGDPGASSP